MEKKKKQLFLYFFELPLKLGNLQFCNIICVVKLKLYMDFFYNYAILSVVQRINSKIMTVSLITAPYRESCFCSQNSTNSNTF